MDELVENLLSNVRYGAWVTGDLSDPVVVGTPVKVTFEDGAITNAEEMELPPPAVITGVGLSIEKDGPIVYSLPVPAAAPGDSFRIGPFSASFSLPQEKPKS